MKPAMSILVLFLYLLPLATINFSFCNNGTYMSCIESEKQALLSFKQDLNDLSNRRFTSWSDDVDCCIWAGVVCDNFTGHVLELHLENSQLHGKINSAILDLKDLIYLNLSYNEFEGIQIPRFLGSMNKLKYLDLSEARFSGMIPYQLGNLSNLRYLHLGDWLYPLYFENFFSLSSLRLLEHLDLSYVNLNKTSDWLLAINNLPNLRVLLLSHCQLQNFPLLLIANFSSLTVLDLSKNKLSESTPSWIFGLSELVFLSLSENSFQGPIPDGLQNLTSLRHFDLSYNFFNSLIPNWLYQFSHLEYLSLSTFDYFSSSKLEGKIPRAWGRLCNLISIYLDNVRLNQKISEVLDIFSECVSDRLEVLYLRHGQLFGHLTNKIGKFKNLDTLYLSHNFIVGHVPLSIGEISSLILLDLSYNKLDGTIYEIHFTNLTKLKMFDVSENSLTFKVSHDWIPPFKLQGLGLRSCNLGPRFPSWLHSQKDLYVLDISNSKISDIISNRVWNFFSQIPILNLSHNNIHGQIPNLRDFARLDSLDINSNNLSGPLPLISSEILEINLSNNNFSGSIFQFLCYERNKVQSLVFLNLKNNSLSGELPNCWANWTELRFLHLGNNKFVGNLPTSMGSLSRLQSLHLHNNQFFGAIPSSLQNLINLKVLDISQNGFVGTVPLWIGERFSGMIILNLRSNKFHGVLPMEFCQLSSLQILDLSYNNLSGSIPRCVNNISAMVSMKYSIDNDLIYGFTSVDEYPFFDDEILLTKGKMNEYDIILHLVRIMDLSNNNFFGEIPIEMTKLEALQSLNLSHNFLTGRIPETIDAMKSIESIDFSTNQLSGEIPSSISDLTFLNHLSLANNNLTGKIPWGTQIQSLDASCFTGNELCGSPLPKSCTTTISLPEHEKGGKDGNEDAVNWFYVGMALGFVVGFWIVIGPLLVNRQWRYMYCRFLDGLGNKFCCFVRK